MAEEEKKRAVCLEKRTNRGSMEGVGRSMEGVARVVTMMRKIAVEKIFGEKSIISREVILA